MHRMTRKFRRRAWRIPACALATLALLLMLMLFDPGGWAMRTRERVFDALILATPRAAQQMPVMVIDIDRTALDRLGSWPWPRPLIAKLIDGAASQDARVIAIDMLLAEDRGDASAAGTPGDLEQLSKSVAHAKTVLGLVLDPSRSDPGPQGPPLLVQEGDARVGDMLGASGVTGPVGTLRDAARGLGVLTLPTIDGEPVRAAPLLAAGGGDIHAGLALEALRVATGEGNLVIDARRKILRVDKHSIALAPDATIRLWPSTAEHRAARTIRATDFLENPSAWREQLAGKILLIGASAPEAGGLRPTAADPFMPSMQIQADAIEQLIAGRAPMRPARALVWETCAAILGALTALVAVMRQSPARAALTALGLVALAIGASFAFWRSADWLVDSLWPSLAVLAAWQAASLGAFVDSRARRLALERSFATRLPPEIVARLAANPDEMKLAGEEREVTALFTDIEGFTPLTERMPAQELVALLDRYFDCVCGIVIAHGGMVDKIVGDAVHALFNAPLDLADHADCAIECALAIARATQEFCARPQNSAHCLGRTRIGVETGRAILGDVGASGKLDYTAHGSTINLAARLEAANKQFGSSIAVGPGCVAASRRHEFRDLGVFEPFAGSPPVIAREPIALTLKSLAFAGTSALP